MSAKLTAGDVIILDGGVSSELERRGVPMTDGLWSGGAVLTHFDALRELHCDYISAGADVITTNTYASSRLLLEPLGLGANVEEINNRAIEAAMAARDACGQPGVLIAGSMSHMLPIFADGRRPGTGRPATVAEMTAAFRELAELHRSAGVDVLLLEMMCLPERVAAMMTAVGDIGMPVWCGLAAARGNDGTLVSNWSGFEVPFEDVLSTVVASNFDVVGVMHTRADLIAEAITAVRAHHAGPLMAYPDSGHFKMPHWQFDDRLSPTALKDYAARWIAEGVQIIGGCCGLGPDHIQALASLKTG